ncbi:MAG: restriction endonuclease [Parcubacteria group bacterium]|nr:restriction endonuclease [Parcubacteria group bacterium]
MEITKASGETEEFQKEKLCESLRASGAPEAFANAVCEKVTQTLKPGATTSEIFRRALRHLVKENVGVAARYSLKRGVADLGPAGFYFEQFVEVMLRAMGYATERNRFLEGECVTHEIDVLAQKEHEHFFIEAKFRNDPGIKTHVDVVMYAWARLDDIRRIEEAKEKNHASHGMWVITNTKFTESALQYAACKKLRTTGWNNPRNAGLEDIITQYALYPVTVLPSLDRYSLQTFARHNMMLAQDIIPYSGEDLAQKFGIKKSTAEKISGEAHALIPIPAAAR